MKIEKLKQKAREHELSEEWSEALSLYRRAVEALEEAEEPDIALLNRMADLQVRDGNLEAALESYEDAIDLYLEADLPNNAIAICRKMIRNAPGRPEIFRRMGEIRAHQGFVVDARQNYLTYAEMMEAQGEREKALEGLNELVTLLPDDAETRIFLGEQLIAADLEDEGVPHLLHAWSVLARAGDEERAAELEERIRTVDPGARFPDPHSPTVDDELEHAGAGDEDDFGLKGFETTDQGVESAPGELDEPEIHEPDGVELETHGVGVEGGFADEFDEDFGLEDALDDDETTPAIQDVEPEAPELDEPSFEEIEFENNFRAGDDEEAEEHATLEADDVPESTEPLPFLEPDVPGVEAIESVESDLERIRSRIAEDPDDPDRHEEMVEYAYRTDDRTLLLGAFVGLAGALDRRGAQEKSQSVWEQVLQLDPGNASARDALGREVDFPSEGVEARKPVTGTPEPTADPGSFVDLGAMVLDDDEVGTTRWVAPGHEPSGDEAMDFAGMLSDFKDKVARNLDQEDNQARYDLGAAYMEMGLVDEAIAMFQAALRARPDHLASIEMLGQCFLEKDEPRMARRVLDRALHFDHPIEDDLLGIYYYLGEAHERAGNPDDAREFYEKVFALDINFKDVTDRLRSLIS